MKTTKNMIRNCLLALGYVLLLESCSHGKNSNIEKNLSAFEETYVMNDKNGTFIIKSSSSLNKSENTYSTKKTMQTPKRGTGSILEQVLVVSSVGKIKNKISTLRPRNSNYVVWFDGKKYTSELKINTRARAFDLKTTSPEPGQSGSKQIKFPNTKNISCFFTHVVECGKVVGFVQKAIKEKTGKMNLFVVWEGYPFLNETFTDFPLELFSEAELEFDKEVGEGQSQFNLQVAGQSIFLVVDKNLILNKMFWVTQGMTMVTQAKARELKESSLNESDEDWP